MDMRKKARKHLKGLSNESNPVEKTMLARFLDYNCNRCEIDRLCDYQKFIRCLKDYYERFCHDIGDRIERIGG